MKSIKKKIQLIYNQLNDVTGGLLDIIHNTLQRFSQNRAPEAAASIAYYAFFSLFPLMLFLVVGGSSILESQTNQEQLIDYITNAIPLSQELIRKNVLSVIRLRGPVSAIAIIGLLWSGTSVFNSLVLNINRAFPGANQRNFMHRRLVALGIVAFLWVLVILTIMVTALVDLLPHINLSALGFDSSFETQFWKNIANLVPISLRLLIFWGLYRWIPTVKVRGIAALYGSLFVTLVWELLANGFTWYLSSGFARYELVYGSLGTVVALMIWIYLSSYIMLLGAYLTSAIDYSK